LAVDDYAVLGLQPGADLQTIRRAYTRLKVSEHPDKHGNSPASTERFKQIGAAFKRIERQLLTTELEVPLHVLVRGGVVRFQAAHDGRRCRLTVPTGAHVGQALVAQDDEGRPHDVIVKVLAPDGWAVDKEEGVLVTDLLIPWLAAYRGDALSVTTPDGHLTELQLQPGSDTDMFVDLDGLGVPGLYTRGPARYRLRLVPPPPGSARIIAALEAPWG
jgi:DnaJ-class molecular chaperone